jgi:glycerate 2-kinase
MKITIAPDSFKNCLSAKNVAFNLAEGIRSVIPDAEIFEIPLADGGEGTLDALINTNGGQYHDVIVKDPLMRNIKARFGMLNKQTAVVEMAEASGLERLKPDEYNPLLATTFGTGQLIEAAIIAGAREIIVAVGGSATNDGGAGMAQALGAKLTDFSGKNVAPGAASLEEIHQINTNHLQKKMSGISVKVAVDVKNPLLGPSGATAMYGQQKGADEKMLEELERKLTYFVGLLEKTLQVNIRNLPGAGAAGGLAAGLAAFLKAEIVPGFELVSHITNLEEYIQQSDIVITAEGKMDAQTSFGKTPFGVAKMAAKYSKPVFGFAGMLSSGYEKLLKHGFTNFYPIAEGPASLETSIKFAAPLLNRAAARMARTLLAGQKLKT